MAYISVNNNESIESALRRFKRKVISEEIIKDLKKHAHFIPPGQKAKLKSVNARKRNRRRFRQQRPMGPARHRNRPGCIASADGTEQVVNSKKLKVERCDNEQIIRLFTFLF